MAETITSALIRDHAAALRMIAQLERDPRLAPDLYPTIADAVRRHSSAEEATLYQALDGFTFEQPTVASLEQGHHQIGALLDVLDRIPYGSPAFMPTFLRMSQALDAHIDFEEAQVFPEAKQILARARQLALGRRYNEKMGRGRSRNVSILLPSTALARNGCGCAGQPEQNPCGCAKCSEETKNPPSPFLKRRRWYHHFMGAGPALVDALK